jgi:8-oxo-dGTP pyrophosphatase MutT (NUDIX family)
MVPPPESIYRQSGAVPFRVRDGTIEVLLITSLTSGRWIIPKGIIEPQLSSAASAAQEAFEEAGVRGELSVPVGQRVPVSGRTGRSRLRPLRIRGAARRCPGSGAAA